MIPEDVIYNIIFPFLINQDECNLTDPQIVLVNKRVYSSKPACFSPKLCFGGQRWCLVHTPHEYNFSKYIKQKIDLAKPKELLARLPIPPPNPYLNDHSLSYHDSTRLYTPNELLYYWKRILEKTSYQINHLCCGGNGITFSDRLAEKNIY